MLKDNRVRLLIALVVIAIVAIGGYLFYDNVIVSSQTGAAGTGQPVAPTLALKKNTPVSANPDARFVMDRPAYIAQTTSNNFYTSCTDDRKATATPTSNAPVPVATVAATAVATAAATTAPPAASEPILLEISGKESEACYQVGEVFINENNRFGLAVGVSTAISGQIAIDKGNVANSQVGQIVVDLSQLQSDSSMRDGQIRRRWLESNKFPLARFTPSEIVGLPNTPYKEGDTLTFIIKGALTVREKDRPTDFSVTAAFKEGVLYGTAYADVKMSDWGFEAPDVGIIKANSNARIILNFVAREPKK